jgi:transcriptional regulator with GAF, ATPase, and Fis domain
VLREKEIERVGGSGPVKVDIRVIAATHRNLEAMLQEGRFREDLYFRLEVFPIVIPPLRERLNDIPALVHYLMFKKARQLGFSSPPSLAPEAMGQLTSYHWPGNVRELENVVERALILNGGRPPSFPDLQGRKGSVAKPAVLNPRREDLKLDTVVADHIRKVLETTGGRVEGKAGAAEILGVNPGTLRHRMRKLGIVFGRAAKTA